MTATQLARLGRALSAAGERAPAAPWRNSRLERRAALRPRASSRAQAELLQDAPAARYNSSVPASGAGASGLTNGSRTNGSSSRASPAGAAAAAVADAGLIITTFRWPAALGKHVWRVQSGLQASRGYNTGNVCGFCMLVRTACSAPLPAGLLTSPPPLGLPASLPGGHEVSVCGSFSNWEPLALHQAAPGGDFVRR